MPFLCFSVRFPSPRAWSSKRTSSTRSTRTTPNWRGTLGKIRDYDYVLELDTPAVRNLIWRVEFERDTENGKEVEQDMLFRLVTGKVDDEVCVLSCGFL